MSLLSRAGVSACLLLAAASAAAQWPSWPTPNVPRTADGTPDLEAPAPRTAEGRPDFSGIWEIRRPGAGLAEGEEAPSAPPGRPPYAAFFDIGANFEVPYLPVAAALREQRMADGMKDNPDAHCLPMGHMQFHLHPQPRKIIQVPNQLVILYEGNAGIRQIHTDGRPLPDNDPQPWWYGYSAGRWEGDELVVETIGFRDNGWLDVNGSPLSSEALIIERFRRPNYGSMEIDVTIDDPKYYSEPFSVSVDHRIMLDTNLIEFVCIENEMSTRFFDP